MSNLQIFNFEDCELEWFTDSDNNPACQAQQLGQILGFTASYVPKVVERVYPKFKFQSSMGKSGRPAWYLREPGIYQMIFESKSDVAQKFQLWVFEEVLPKLRAEGGYIMPSATLQQLENLQAQVEHHKNRIANLSKVHELTQFQTGLYNHPRLALAAITKACSFDFSDADKEKVRLMVRSHSSTGNYSWKVSIREWVSVIYTLTGISIPQELLAYWLAEWGYKIVASGGKRLTQTYSVEMLPLNKSNKLKIAERLKIA